MALLKKSLDDNLGVPSSHFFKSGHWVRDESLTDLTRLREMLPTNGPNNTHVEYDIWYDMGDINTIHGYTYTDVLNKFIYLRTANYKIVQETLVESVKKNDVTEEGNKIFQDLVENNSDKYKLRRTREKNDYVIFFPGGNIYDKIVDENVIEEEVKNGAKIKLHPITQDVLAAKIKHRFGKNNVIDKNISGHNILDNCEKVASYTNSEMCLIGVIKGKEIKSLGNGGKQFTYCALYNAIFDRWPEFSFSDTDTYQERFKKILSDKTNGLIPVLSDDPQERINLYFNKFKGYTHVPPRNSGD